VAIQVSGSVARSIGRGWTWLSGSEQLDDFQILDHYTGYVLISHAYERDKGFLRGDEHELLIKKGQKEKVVCEKFSLP